MNDNVTDPLKPTFATSPFKILIAAVIAALLMPALTWYANKLLTPDQAKQYIDFLYVSIGGTGLPSLSAVLISSVKKTFGKVDVQKATTTAIPAVLAETVDRAAGFSSAKLDLLKQMPEAVDLLLGPNASLAEASRLLNVDDRPEPEMEHLSE